MPAQPTVSDYLAANVDRFSLELNNEGKALLIALAELLDSGVLADAVAAGMAGVSAPTVVHSSVYEASHVLKASPGTLVALIGYNSKASAQFIQLFNATALPADASVPVATFTVAASSNFSLTIPLTGLPMTTGIVVCNSSTGPTKTIGSADCWFTAVLK